MNTRSEQEHIEYLLTADAFENWLFMESGKLLLIDFYDFSSTLKSAVEEAYLKSIGLPNDSIIRGL